MNIILRLFGLLIFILSTGCVNKKATLHLTPKIASACDLPITTRVNWDVQSLGLSKAKLEINDFGKPAKVWVVGEATGSEISGAWAWDGYTVTLKSMNGVVLARRTLTTTPCPDKDWL